MLTKNNSVKSSLPLSDSLIKYKNIFHIIYFHFPFHASK